MIAHGNNTVRIQKTVNRYNALNWGGNGGARAKLKRKERKKKCMTQQLLQSAGYFIQLIFMNPFRN
jgi:hypothetical protein